MPVSKLNIVEFSPRRRNFKNWLQAYIDFTSISEAPTPFHFWTGVSTIAGALRRRVWIDQKAFQWTPNFYIVLVAPPGIATKSTSIKLGTHLLENIDGVHFGPNSLTWPSLASSLEAASEQVPLIAGAQPTDNPEYISMSAITCHVGELGTFLRPEDRKLVDVLTDLWDGQVMRWQHDTKTQGKTTIINPWLNILAATTPAWLKDNMPEAMIGGGLTSRMVFVFADKKRHLIAYPADLVQDEEFHSHYNKLVEDLKQISLLVGEYKLTEEAKAWGRKWYEDHWKGERPKHLASDRFGGYVARKQTHIHKLGMIIAAAQRDELLIDASDLQAAAQITSALETDMIHVFESIGVADTSRFLFEILAYLRAYKSITQQELWQLCFSIMSPQNFSEAIDSGIKAGFLRAVNRGGNLFYEITDLGKTIGKRKSE